MPEKQTEKKPDTDAASSPAKGKLSSRSQRSQRGNKLKRRQKGPQMSDAEFQASVTDVISKRAQASKLRDEAAAGEATIAAEMNRRDIKRIVATSEDGSSFVVSSARRGVKIEEANTV